MDQIGDGLRLDEIHLAVEESTLGELARLGHPCAGIERTTQNFAQHHGTPVPLNFDGVFAGITFGCTKDEAKPLVNFRSVLINNLAEDKGAALFSRGVYPFDSAPFGFAQDRQGRQPLEHFVRDFPNLGTADADDADAALPGRCSDGGNGIGGAHWQISNRQNQEIRHNPFIMKKQLLLFSLATVLCVEAAPKNIILFIGSSMDNTEIGQAMIHLITE